MQCDFPSNRSRHLSTFQLAWSPLAIFFLEVLMTCSFAFVKVSSQIGKSRFMMKSTPRMTTTRLSGGLKVLSTFSNLSTVSARFNESCKPGALPPWETSTLTVSLNQLSNRLVCTLTASLNCSTLSNSFALSFLALFTTNTLTRVIYIQISPKINLAPNPIHPSQSDRSLKNALSSRELRRFKRGKPLDMLATLGTACPQN
mmetsp:Transcript_8889/g.16714  ORF Transcript_8889/g.16714 Transcript_8889/m.16714 type:complete len:201 (-) Transcript_8889:154-756(-)